MSPHSFEMFVFFLCRLISFLVRVPPIRSRVTPAAVRISILSAIVPVIRTTDTVIAAVVATLIPLITSTRNHHEAGHDNSVHDYSEIVHQTLPFAATCAKPTTTQNAARVLGFMCLLIDDGTLLWLATYGSSILRAIFFPLCNHPRAGQSYSWR